MSARRRWATKFTLWWWWWEGRGGYTNWNTSRKTRQTNKQERDLRNATENCYSELYDQRCLYTKNVHNHSTRQSLMRETW